MSYKGGLLYESLKRKILKLLQFSMKNNVHYDMVDLWRHYMLCMEFISVHFVFTVGMKIIIVPLCREDVEHSQSSLFW